MNEKVYFIADIAANHDGSLKRALNLCDLAKASGADGVKFQHFKAETIVSDSGFKNLGSKKSHQTNWKESVFEVYKKLSVPLEWTRVIKNHCDNIGVDFFTTPYDLNYIDELDQYVTMYKIGSGDITWHKILKKVATKGKPVLLATGASKMEEVDAAMKILQSFDIPIVIMQCNTNYTCSEDNYNDINLNVLNTFRKKYPSATLGLSDHTLDDTTTLGAVSLGALYIEKHFTDDNNRIGPDHSFSMNPESWKLMVNRTRILEASLGKFNKEIEFNEKETVVLQRRAIRVNKNITKNHIIQDEDINYTRPCPEDALPASFNPVGKKIKKDLINKNEYLKNSDFYDM